MKRRRFCLLALLTAAMPIFAQELHGAGDSFAAEGVSIVWGVLRGATEGATEVHLRIVADPKRYARLNVVNQNPFTGAEVQSATTNPISAAVIVRIPRARFADFPRTELRFFGAESNRAPGKPALVVYYLGVPDTTPEFNDAQALTRRLEGQSR